jgi:circadian clock protein KaiB
LSTPSTPGNPDPAGRTDAEIWSFRLYIAGQSSKSMSAVTNLRRICEEHLRGRYTVEVVDLTTNPQAARSDQVLAVPTLVRKVPAPARKIIGDLSNTDRALAGLELKPRS